jgi:hypothetical protein
MSSIQQQQITNKKRFTSWNTKWNAFSRYNGEIPVILNQPTPLPLLAHLHNALINLQLKLRWIAACAACFNSDHWVTGCGEGCWIDEDGRALNNWFHNSQSISWSGSIFSPKLIECLSKIDACDLHLQVPYLQFIIWHWWTALCYLQKHRVFLRIENAQSK